MTGDKWLTGRTLSEEECHCTVNGACVIVPAPGRVEALAMRNQLFCGDNLEVLRLREYFPDECIDLVYLDPPFKKYEAYNLLFREKDGSKCDSQILAFEDAWEWNIEAEKNYASVAEQGGKVAQVMALFRTMFPDTDMLAYLSMMAPRLLELRRVLKPNGSLYLHCDSTAAHYLKVLMDAIFSPQRFLNEITWKRTHSHGNVSRNFGSITDTLLVYTKSDGYEWNQQYTPFTPEYIQKTFKYTDPDGRKWQSVTLRNPGLRPNLHFPFKASNGVTYQPHPNGWGCDEERLRKYDAEKRLHFPAKATGALRLKMYLDESPGVRLQNIWDDIPAIGSQAAERLGYPTQKPVQLLERIISASSNPGDVILDPFCGCGTAIETAYKTRTWIGIDITYQAMRVIREERFPKLGLQLNKDYEMIYRPRDITAAEAFAKEQPFSFQDWVVEKLDGEIAPHRSGDRGIDGKLYFRDTDNGPLRPIIVSVKGGKLKATFVRELAGAVSSEHAPMGILVVLQKHSKQMIRDAANYGFYASALGRFPKIQVITVRDILENARLDLPPIHKIAATKRVRATSASQMSLPGLAS